MNCTKCPFAEECRISKVVMMSNYVGEVSVPVHIVPYTPEECPLLKKMKEIDNEQTS